MVTNYLESVEKQFKYYKMLGEKTIQQCSDEMLFDHLGEGSNSIAIIVNHIGGNMLSRWTDFLVADGEKSWRNRDQEFAEVITTREELIQRWESGWSCLFTAIESINEENINTEIFIRNQGHTVVEAINRQMCHYSYHIGQIVLIGKAALGNDWVSLSISKGKSEAYNANHFNSSKSTQHFTDNLLS